MFDSKKINSSMCCGCGACKTICPQKAITMNIASNGFLYPVVDMDKCIRCGLCEKTCNFDKFVPTGNKPRCYAVRHKNSEELATSRSGGFFAALAEYVISEDGVVFGCELDENLQAVHMREDTYNGCLKFKGSKYVQSDTKNTFGECEKALKLGKMVLYSGTGCQVHGLITYLNTKKINTDNLITVDIVCHGVPSPGVWKNYIFALEYKHGKRITDVNFRDKTINGWADHIEKYTFEDGSTMRSKQWTNIFYRHVLFREACYRCKYTTTERLSDFTIADYWGIGKNAPEYDDNKGCSMVLTHNSKAKNILISLADKVDYKETDLSTSLQPQLMHPIWRGWDYSCFWKRYGKKPEDTVKKYFFPSWGRKLFWKIERQGKDISKAVLRIIKWK